MTCPSCARRAGGAIFQRPLMTPPPADHPSSQSPDAAFEREALPWLDDVYRFALSLTRDASDADDVVQETFLRAY
ncbi:MAG: RNA polymerase subunit sigma, partial [Gemmatimonadota bacterium]|nr:RNA polymerase subunit sigma [Gemmatimonadota bacterium]